MSWASRLPLVVAIPSFLLSLRTFTINPTRNMSSLPVISFPDFVQQSSKRADALLGQDGSNPVLVVGNEAADMDSIVSSLVYAYVMEQLTHRVHIPVVDLPHKDDLRLRPEVCHVLSQHGLTEGDIPLKPPASRLAENLSHLSLTLVDHNCLSVENSGLAAAVTSVIDHHEDRNCYRDQCKEGIYKVEMVGSCATLVAEEALRSEVSMTKVLATLLWQTILVDTQNLDESKGRTTSKDSQIVATLESSYLGLDSGMVQEARNQIYGTLQTMKFDTSKFSADDLLRRDVKVSEVDHGPQSLRVVISSVTTALDDFTRRVEPDLSQVAAFSSRTQADILIVMFAFTNADSKQFQRQLLVFHPQDSQLSADIYGQFLNELEEAEALSLHMMRLETIENPKLVGYDQGNIKATRKAVEPLARKILTNLCSSSSNL